MPAWVVPPEMRGRLQPTEIFHEVLEHRWFLSERQERPIAMHTATKSYIETVLTVRPDEVLAGEPDTIEMRRIVLDDD